MHIKMRYLLHDCYKNMSSTSEKKIDQSDSNENILARNRLIYIYIYITDLMSHICSALNPSSDNHSSSLSIIIALEPMDACKARRFLWNPLLSRERGLDSVWYPAKTGENGFARLHKWTQNGQKLLNDPRSFYSTTCEQVDRSPLG